MRTPASAGHVFPILLAVLALASCAREPQRPLLSPLESGTPWWDNYGYSEKELSGNRLEVVYLSRQEGAAVYFRRVEDLERMLLERTDDFALWRASELSLEKRFPAFVIVDKRIEVTEKIIGRDPKMGFTNARTYLFNPMNPQSYASIWLQPKAVLTVELLEDGAPDSPDVYDARETAAWLANKYPAAREPVASVDFFP